MFDNLNTKIVILAGGTGTRLRPFTASFPKPLVPVGDMPILEILLRQMYCQGFRNVILTLGHLADLIRAYFTQHKSLNKEMNISFVDEDMPTGTSGSLSSVPNLDSTFVVMNGDILTNMDFSDLINYHKKSEAILTIATHKKYVKIDLGVLEIDDAGRLIGYLEKPEKYYDVSMGIYVYEPEVLTFIEPGEYLEKSVQSYRTEAFWLDIGRPEDYAQAQEIFQNKPELFGF
jgi:NDP-sugar pyrophosphorylase family protein